MTGVDRSTSATVEQWVDIDVWCGDNRVERLTFQEGDDFKAEVYSDDYRLEVVEIREVDTAGDESLSFDVGEFAREWVAHVPDAIRLLGGYAIAMVGFIVALGTYAAPIIYLELSGQGFREPTTAQLALAIGWCLLWLIAAISAVDAYNEVRSG